MKILVVLTGGTIGSKISEKIIDVNPASAYHLINLYQEKYGTDTEFEVIQPMNILSENLMPAYWTTLYDCLDKVKFDKYDGVIITHGSDTLAYTAAMTGFCYAHTKVPIVLIASNYALEDTRSNGLANFYNAVCFIREKKVNGVFVIFQNDRKENIVYLSTRLKEADTYRDQFSSYGGVDFGRVYNGHFERTVHEQNPTLEELNTQGEKMVVRNRTFEKSVLLLHPYPGLDYSRILLDDSVGAVLHCTYHSSTVCEGTGKYSAVEFVNKCRKKGIEVYACSFKLTENLYATSAELLRVGVIPLMNISAETAYAKLTLACNQKMIDTKKFMEENIYYEILPSLTSLNAELLH